MIMVLTHRSDLRKQLSEVLQASGYSVAIPSHREERLPMLIEYRPVLIVLDLYVSDPSGTEELKELRDHGYRGTVMLLSGSSMMSVLKEAYASGITRVISVPACVNGRYLLGELQAAVRNCMQEIHAEQHKDALVARRAYELYEARGRHDGSEVQDWLQAEQEIRAVAAIA
jgi:DNA-binding response OmpR family regulator